MTFKADELIAKALEIDRHIKAREEALAEELKPYKEGRQAIEGVLLQMLNDAGAQNFKTDEGTAYKTQILHPKVVNRDDFLKVCVDNWTNGGGAMLQIGTIKGGVKDWLETHEQAPPPGVEISYSINLNIRKS